MATVDPNGEKLDKLLSGLDSITSRLDAVEEKEKAKADSGSNIEKFIDAFTKRMDAECEERKADRKRLDDVSSMMDAFGKRMDAMSKKDAEETEDEKKAKADATAKKDAEEKEAEKAKADAAARADSNASLMARLAEMDKRIPAQLPENERSVLASEQAKAERVHQAFGDSAGAPHWLNGESRVQYVARLASKFKDHSKDWKSVDLNVLPEAALDVAATRIYADALAEAAHPTTVRPGVLLPQFVKDAAGRVITKYVGDPNACWDQFNPPVRHVRRILTNGIGRVQ